MAQLYNRFLNILKKWPVEEERTINCFGKYLRDSSSKWFTPDGRPIGSPDVCEQRLVSLERLCNDVYRQKYPASVKGVTGMSIEECKAALVEDYEGYGKRTGIFNRILSKFRPNTSQN